MPYSEITQEVLDQIIDLMEKKDFKNKLIKEINEDVDVPMINEKTEKKVFDSIYKLMIKSLKSLELDWEIHVEIIIPRLIGCLAGYG